MKKTIVSMLFILIGVMLGAIATQFVEIDTGGPYYVESAAGYVTVGAYLDGVLVTPHQPLQQGDQRIAISYPPFYYDNPTWVNGTVTYTHTGTYYTIQVPFQANSGTGATDRQGNFRIDIQVWDVGENAWVSSLNSTSWHNDFLYQYQSTVDNQFQNAITYALNNTKIDIPAGVHLGSLVIQDKTNVTISGAGMHATTIKGAGHLPALRIIGCSNVKIQNMTITSGSSENGGGVFCDSSTVTIENCRVIDNNAY